MALNTVGVNASVDDRGRIVRWFDKEAAFSVLAGPWFETEDGSVEPIPWRPAGSTMNAPTYRWDSGQRSVSKFITAGFRSIGVAVQSPDVQLVSCIDLAMDDDDAVEDSESGLTIVGRRAVVRLEYHQSGRSVETIPGGVRVTVRAESKPVRVSVADLTDRL